MYEGPITKDHLKQKIDKNQDKLKSFREQGLWRDVQEYYVALYNQRVLRDGAIFELNSTPVLGPRGDATMTACESIQSATVPRRRHPME